MVGVGLVQGGGDEGWDVQRRPVRVALQQRLVLPKQDGSVCRVLHVHPYGHGRPPRCEGTLPSLGMQYRACHLASQVLFSRIIHW